MAFDITTRHPSFVAYQDAWRLMRDAIDGEDAIKRRGEIYLPMKSGTAAINDSEKRDATYTAYKTRAEFPELVALTARGAVGVMLDQPATVELPTGLEPLRERATRDGLTLDSLHRRITMELMATGRYGLLPSVDRDGVPYLAGYTAETIINWDTTDEVADYVVLNETAHVRNRETGEWAVQEQYRECFVQEGAYFAREWVRGATDWAIGEDVPGTTRKGALDFLPFVFIDTNDLTPEPDDVPLYGLAKLAVRIYRMDADYTFALHMTAEPTPVVIGFEDPNSENVPKTVGSSKLWILPQGGDAKFLEFSGAGLQRQEAAIRDALDRAVMFGAQLLTDSRRTAESGEAIRLRMGSQTSVLKSIAMTSAAGLENALKNIAVWKGENPDDVVVTPVTDFFEHTLSAQELTAIVKGWQDGAYSFQTMFNRLEKADFFPDGHTAEDELKLIDEEEEDEPPPPIPMTGLLPAQPEQPGADPQPPPVPAAPQTNDPSPAT